MPANQSTTSARTCALCAHALCVGQDRFCDGLCAAAWRQLHETGTNTRQAVMPADVARTLKQVLCGDIVERSSAIRLYAWLRQPSQPASRSITDAPGK